MRKELKILIGLSLIVLLGVVLATTFYKKTEPTPQTGSTSVPFTPAGEYGVTLREEFVREDSPTMGPKNAKVTVVEFLDPECESCRAFHPIMKEILKSYEGGIHFVVRYMAYHTSSALAVAATEAAGLQGKYWEMQDLLFNTADEWGHQPQPNQEFFLKYAGQLGLNVEQFKKDLVDPRWQAKVERDMNDGKALGVRGTPTIFVNGEVLEKLGFEGLRTQIEKHLRSPN